MFKLVIQDDEGKNTIVPLLRDEITIGRKEGNTIRLTERNVSRKHARISRANGAVAIEDLGSDNGVRVNGTRISQRTVLSVSDRVQIGDYLIELKAEGGEVPVPYEDARTVPVERIDPAQLAAVPPPPMVARAELTASAAPAMQLAPPAAAAAYPGVVQPYVVRETPIADVPTRKRNRWLYALLGAAAIGGVIAVVVSSGGGSTKPAAVTGGAEATVGEKPGEKPGEKLGEKPGEKLGDPGETMVRPPVDDGPGVEQLLATARTAIGESTWADALAAANAALAREPDNVEARTLASQAKTEADSQRTYDEFMQASARHAYAAAIAKFDQIPSASVYKNPARDTYDPLHAQYVAAQKREGLGLARANKCRELARLADESRRLSSEAGAAVDAIACGDGEAEVKQPRVDRKPPADVGNPPAPTGDPQAILAEAGSAARSGDYGRALKLAEQVIKSGAATGSAAVLANSIAALASCNLKNAAKARVYYAKASPQSKGGIRQVCLRFQIDPVAP